MDPMAAAVPADNALQARHVMPTACANRVMRAHRIVRASNAGPTGVVVSVVSVMQAQTVHKVLAWIQTPANRAVMGRPADRTAAGVRVEPARAMKYANLVRARILTAARIALIRTVVTMAVEGHVGHAMLHKSAIAAVIASSRVEVRAGL